jgi:antitoxin Phd
MRSWSLQDAKARFSELVNDCLAEGPQLVTRYGRNAVVVVPADEYERALGPRQSLAELFASAPRVELSVDRPIEAGRSVVL